MPFSNATLHPPPDNERDEPLTVVLVVDLHLAWRMMVAVVLCGLCAFVVRTYVCAYDPVYGWTKMISFGGLFAPRALPRVQRLTHYVTTPPEAGADGQFYAQVAVDPSLRDPAFDDAFDNATYRTRRIGLSVFAYVFAGGKPRRVLQVYAVANLFFWFVLLAALAYLLRPLTGRGLLCLCAALLTYGIAASMKLALTDLPATALLCVALALGSSWGGYGAVAASALTRETSALAVFSLLDLRQTWRQPRAWWRALALLTVGLAPLAAWILYVLHRFGHPQKIAGARNFGWPFVDMSQALAHCAALCWNAGINHAAPLGWLYVDEAPQRLATMMGLCAQLLYLVLRRDWAAAVWRTGLLYAGLCAVLGPGVWEEPVNAARAALPMTVCFYLQLARERRRGWFWPFFSLGSLSLPYAVHEFWTVL